MAKHTQYEFDWNQRGEVAEKIAPGQSSLETPAAAFAEESFSTVQVSQERLTPPVETATPKPTVSFPNPVPLPEAVARGVFGRDDDGVINPSQEEVDAITEEQGNRLLELLTQLAKVNISLASTAEEIPPALEAEKDRLTAAYRDAVAMYAEDFGDETAAQLDAWAQSRLESDGDYDLGHPWHYYSEGDSAEPIPFEQIQPALDADFSSLGALPKNPAKRTEKLHTLLNDQQEQLKRDKFRYQELIEGGVDSLSEYDRNIAHNGDDDLAWASAIALKYNHIRAGMARVAWLGEQLKQPPASNQMRRRSGRGR